MHLIYEALKKTNGNTDGDGAGRRRQGHEVGEPARPDVGSTPRRATSSRPSTSGAVQKVGGKLVNVEFDKIENVKDPVKAAMKK